MKLSITLSIATLLLFAIVCGAQTLTNPVGQVIASAPNLPEHAGWTLASTNPPPAAWKWKTANDAATLFSDLTGLNITGKQVMGFIGFMGAVFGASRIARKLLPDKWQASNLGLVLSHLAMEVNPTIAKLKEAAESPTGQSIEALIEAKINQRIQTLANPLPASAFIPQPQPPVVPAKPNP